MFTLAVIHLSNSPYKLNRTANDPIDGNLIKLKPDATYAEWEKALVLKHGKYEVDKSNQRTNSYPADKAFYDEMSAFISDKHMPTFNKFQEMKYNDDRDWRNLHLDYLRQNKLNNHLELQLPNLNNLDLPIAKFTKYLFNPGSEVGWPKGQLITNKLGIGTNNYQELRKIILDAAVKYPAISKGDLGHGERYQQNIIVYDKDNHATNMLVAWIDDHGSTRMTTTFIEEAKDGN
ncbi:hypothetical protein C5Z26_02000 [Lactobacillus sp. CBA3606]|uniref:DUF6883 domain-containing protein n=1 Tax=Lactobacillus sp. CBA3606 TaxID=2099789 RepID=UPI000CFC4AAC|nr:DUF6883 domain-containing protein [Lactobacillus sp. CBA3606]AVK62970.1 hypothetical protein C5Z26_02000 [Lactobacillus sp. CBA3606]